MAQNHEQAVLSAILQGRLDLLQRAMSTLTDGHFTTDPHRVLWKMLHKYAMVTGSILRREALVDSLDNAPAAQVGVILETYDYLAGLEKDEADFKWGILQVKESAAERAVKGAIAEAQAILGEGVEIGGTTKKGQQAARESLITSLATIDRDLSMEESPEGVIQEEYQEILDDYDERKKLKLMGLGEGIRYGVEDLDNALGGYHNGELNLIVGSSSSGKSSMAVALAWHAAISQNKNVVFATTETLRPQIIRKLVARHSKLEKFDIPAGLNTKDLKQGTLTEADEIKRREVVRDLTNNSAYGKIYLMQVPRGSTVASIETKMTHINNTMFPVELAVIDYLGLFNSGIYRSSEREEFNYIIREAKAMAATFNDGAGVPVISPWQINRSGQSAAAKSGSYKMTDLSDTSEAEKSSDTILSLWVDQTQTDRQVDIFAQVLKQRDGERSDPIPLAMDYATCYVTQRSVAQSTRQASSGQSLDLNSFFN